MRDESERACGNQRDRCMDVDCALNFRDLDPH